MVGLGASSVDAVKRLSMLAISWMISVKWLALAGSLGGNDGGDTALCMTEVDGKWGCNQGTKLSNLVSRVDNHFGLLNEGKTKDCVYGDIWANPNKESGWSALAREVR